MGTLSKFAPSVSFGLAEWGLQMSGYTNFYVAVALWSAAALLLLWPALDFYRMRSATEPKVQTTGKHITLTDFITEASKCGWDITGQTNSYILDLIYGLRQAAGEGEIALRGRIDRNGEGILSLYEIKTEIPKSHWQDYEIDWWRNTDNWKIGTLNKHIGWHMCKVGRYLDLELEKRQAMRWLKTKSIAYRGWHDQKKERQNDIGF